MSKADTMNNPTVMYEAAKMYEALGDFAGALSVLGYLIERYTKYLHYNELILRCAILLKHTNMHMKDEKKRAAGLKQAQTYFEYIIPYPIEGWHENDIMMQVARLYEIVPGTPKDKKKNSHMAKEAYKDIFKAARNEGMKSKNPARKAQWRKQNFPSWFYSPMTWVELADQYEGAFEHTLAADAYKEGLRRFKIDWRTEMPSSRAWSQETWSFQPHADIFKRLALCYFSIANYELALATMEQANKLAPYDLQVREKLVEWNKPRWLPSIKEQDRACVCIQRMQRGCWGRRRGRLRLTELVNEAEARRLADRADQVARPLLRGYKGGTWGALFSVEDACATRLSAFAVGIRERKLVQQRREYADKRAINTAVREWNRDKYNFKKREQLAALSPAKYSKLFHKQEKAVAKMRFAWSKIGSKKVAAKRAKEVFAERLKVEEDAANVIQRAARSRIARDLRMRMAEDKQEQVVAATALQSRMRGFEARKEAKKRRAEREVRRAQHDREEKAARYIQSRYRGHASRVDMIKQQMAAERVQAIFRGKIGRQLVARRRKKFAVRLQSFFRMVHDSYRLAGYLHTKVGSRREYIASMVSDLTAQQQNSSSMGGFRDGWVATGAGTMGTGTRIATVTGPGPGPVSPIAGATTGGGVGGVGGSVGPGLGSGLNSQKLWGHVYALTDQDLDLHGRPDEQWRVHQHLKRMLGANTLCAHGASLDADHASTIAEGLMRNKSLHHLVIGNAQIGSEGLLSLAEALRENSSLDTLALGRNGIGGDTSDCPAIGILSTVLRTTNFHLKQIVIEDNRIGNEGCVLLGEAIGDFFSSKFCRLQSMVLNRVGMLDDGGEAIGVALTRNRTITSLQLCGNYLSDRTAVSLGEALGQNSCLRELDLADNHIGSEGGLALSRGVGVGSISTTSVRADGQEITTSSDSQGRLYGGNSTLCRLCLDNNFMREDVWVNFMQSMETNSRLVDISMFGNMMPVRRYHQMKRYMRHRRKKNKKMANPNATPIKVPKSKNSAQIINSMLRQPRGLPHTLHSPKKMRTSASAALAAELNELLEM